MAMKNYILPEDFGNLVINYLITKPYSEVSNLIDGFKALQELVPPEAAAKSPDIPTSPAIPEKTEEIQPVV